ncbi:MAG: PAS domain-containing protein [Chloroflexi bacterium]|nr:PAS domain-containing protein [Chloroflexota bacterium]
MDGLIPLFGNTADACFAVDGQQRVVLWNDAAEALLGHRARQVMGRSCFQVICAVDTHGRAFCQRRCFLHVGASRGQFHPSHRLALQTADGQHRTVDLSTVLVPPTCPGGPYLVHYLRPVERSAESLPPPSAAGSQNGAGGNLLSPLTHREYEVLALLARGATTDQVATALSITRVTARNHIQHLMDKFIAHSRLEVVALARQHHLLPSP